MEKGLLKGGFLAFEFVKGQPVNDEIDFLSVGPEGSGWRSGQRWISAEHCCPMRGTGHSPRDK